MIQLGCARAGVVRRRRGTFQRAAKLPKHRDEAQMHVDEFNAALADDIANTPSGSENRPTVQGVMAYVDRWPWNAASHAADLARGFIP